MKIRTKVRAGALTANHNVKVKTKVRAGGTPLQHNAKPKASGKRVRGGVGSTSGVRAGVKLLSYGPARRPIAARRSPFRRGHRRVAYPQPS